MPPRRGGMEWATRMSVCFLVLGYKGGGQFADHGGIIWSAEKIAEVW
jgi:hypothetical protein